VTKSWTFAVAREELARTTLTETAAPPLSAGEVRLRVDRVGVTANNITYAVLGKSFRYWEFFPPGDSGLTAEWGLPPLWGFADVAESTVDGVPVGDRLYGYLPPAGHLVVRPDRVSERGFRDASAHRAALPAPYNQYRRSVSDPTFAAEREDLAILFRPLFFTSFMLADQLVDNDFYGADTLVLSSASSKTAYGTAFELRDSGRRVVGLTSPSNVEFTAGLGCYHEVLTYDQVDVLDATANTVYLDVSGRPEVRAAIRSRLGDRLVKDVIIGITNQVSGPAQGAIAFFAPTQMSKRAEDWGPDGLDRRFAESWDRFATVVADWVDVTVGHGPEGLRAAWLDVLGGATPARIGHVVAL
jgi:hypothetical protein